MPPDGSGAAATATNADLLQLAASVEQVRQLAREVMALQGEQRQQAIEAQPGLGEVFAAAALLRAAAECLQSPGDAEQLAELALELVSRQHALSLEQRRALRLQALTALVRSRHRLGKLDDAEAACRQAVPLLRAVPALSRDRAALLAAQAQLRWSQGRLDEAAALFGHAAWIWGRDGDRQRQAASLVQAGFVLLELGIPERARPSSSSRT